MCLIEEFSRFYVEILNEFLTEELKIYNEVHLEEWDLIKPDRRDRAHSIMSKIRIALRERGKCGNCAAWKISATEVRENEIATELVAGIWEPTQGLSLQDDIFPHATGGLRKRRILVTAIDVSIAYRSNHSML